MIDIKVAKKLDRTFKEYKNRIVYQGVKHAVCELEDTLSSLTGSNFKCDNKAPLTLDYLKERRRDYENGNYNKVELLEKERKRQESQRANGNPFYTLGLIRHRAWAGNSWEYVPNFKRLRSGGIELEVIQQRPKISSTWVAKYPDQKADLITDICNQPLAASELWDHIEAGHTGFLLVAEPGVGKTYVAGSVLKNFIEHGKIAQLKSYAPIPIFYVTRATVVAQSTGVFRQDFNIDMGETVNVYNIEFFKTEMGNNYVKEEVVVKEGIPETKYRWKKHIHPVFIVWDECQALAREQSIQTKIAIAISELGYTHGDVKVIQFFISATPFTTIAEAKCFCIATRKQWNHFGQMKPITEENWSKFAADISYPYEPNMYSEEAIKNLMAFMSDRIVEIKDVKLKFKAFVSAKRIFFANDEERKEYLEAWNEYEMKKAKIDSDDTMSEAQRRFSILAQFTIFRKAAELCKRNVMADYIHDCWKKGEAAVAGFAFKAPISAVTRILMEKYGWKRSDISLIWGGATETLSTRAKLLNKLKAKGLDKTLEDMGITLEDLDLDNVRQKTEADYLWEKQHGLLTQKPEDREAERLRFQRQDSKCLLFSYKAGSVGISAHHERQYPKARPRSGIYTPIYSEKEAIQGFGRPHRITSISDTKIIVPYYDGTIEVDVMARLIMKMKCARHVGKKNGSWESIVTKQGATIDVDEVEDEEELSDAVTETTKLLEVIDV